MSGNVKRPRVDNTKEDDDDYDSDFVAKEELDSEDELTGQKVATKKKKSSNLALKNDEGDIFFALGPKRRITVRKWKSKPLIDIREFWTDPKDGKDKPGKKGISLSHDQWEQVKSLVGEIDEVLESI